MDLKRGFWTYNWNRALVRYLDREPDCDFCMPLSGNASWHCTCTYITRLWQAVGNIDFQARSYARISCGDVGNHWNWTYTFGDAIRPSLKVYKFVMQSAETISRWFNLATIVSGSSWLELLFEIQRNLSRIFYFPGRQQLQRGKLVEGRFDWEILAVAESIRSSILGLALFWTTVIKNLASTFFEWNCTEWSWFQSNELNG